MELDDLKADWQRTTQPTNTPDIMEIIHQKSRGPLASLKYAYRRHMAAVIALTAAFLSAWGRHVDTVSGEILFWTYLLFCGTMIVLLSYSYRLARRMERTDGPTKDYLQQHIALLERRTKIRQVVGRAFLVLLILLLEIIPHFQSLRMLTKWHAVAPWIRIPAYAGFLVLQYFMSQAISQRRFGRHIDRLKRLLQEVA